MPVDRSDVPLAAPQNARLRMFGKPFATRSLDAHCHCLPGIDDGPKTEADALALCRLLVRDGFTDVIATPHVLGRYDGFNWANDVRAAVEAWNDVLVRERTPLRVHAGSEVRVDERIPGLLKRDQILTLADQRKYLLLELPTAMALSADAVIGHLAGIDLAVVLAHAERYESLRRDPAAAEAWVERGAILQVNAGSLLEDAGPDSRDAAFFWIEQGWLSLLATDSHNVTSRRPRMSEAVDVLAREFGPQVTRALCIDNPARLLGVDSPPQEPEVRTPFDMI
jgi:protein-tyrosine phosphatase